MDVDLTEQRPKFAICVESVIQLSKQKGNYYGENIYIEFFAITNSTFWDQ